MKNDREKIIVKTSVIGIFANICLVIFKAIVGFLAGSITIILDALNNLTDALSSSITIVGTKLSAKKATKKHPLGYGRIEYITSTTIASIIIVAGGTAIVESIQSIIDYYRTGKLPEYSVTSLVIIGVAILVKVVIGIFFRIKANKVDSSALKTSGNDALFDSILSLSTLIGALFVRYANLYIEGYLGLLIGLFILKSGFSALISSLSSIVGERYDFDYTSKIKKDICSIEGVSGAYDLIIHSYGPNMNIGSVHIGVNENLTAKEIQVLEKEISYLVKEKYNLIITVGVYAENQKDPLTIKMKNILQDIVKEYSYILQMHGFYIDKKRSIVSFDLVISFEDQKMEEHIEDIKNFMERQFPKYKFYVNYDIDFSLSE